jgi:hypothetical protein
MNMKKNLLLLVLLCVGLAACESTEGPDTGGQSNSKGDRIFILNQGGYNGGNASLSVFNWTKDTLVNDLVKPLGDVGNDLQYINGKLYAALDNSAKIEVINPDSTADHSSIQFPVKSGPAKIVQISSTEALVPELYNNEIAVINLSSNTIASTISVEAGQYSIAMLGGKAYSASANGKVLKIDPVAKSVLELSPWINGNPSQVVADSQRNVIVLATAGDYVSVPAKIFWLNASTLVPEDSLILSFGSGINVLVPGKDKLYVCLFGERTKVIDLVTHKMDVDPLINKSYFGGYFDASKNLLYMGMVTDYQHDDTVDVFDLGTNSLKKSIVTGVAPCFFTVVR